MLSKSHPYHTPAHTSTQHPYHIYITPTPLLHHTTTTSHPHHIHIHIHITSSYLHPHLICITSIIFSSTHLHHIYTTPPHWHHHHAQSHLMQNDKGISSHPKELCCSPVHNDIMPLTLVANMDCQMHQARPYKDPSISSKMFQHHLFQCSTTST